MSSYFLITLYMFNALRFSWPRDFPFQVICDELYKVTLSQQLGGILELNLFIEISLNLCLYSNSLLFTLR